MQLKYSKVINELAKDLISNTSGISQKLNIDYKKYIIRIFYFVLWLHINSIICTFSKCNAIFIVISFFIKPSF